MLDVKKIAICHTNHLENYILTLNSTSNMPEAIVLVSISVRSWIIKMVHSIMKKMELSAPENNNNNNKVTLFWLILSCSPTKQEIT